MVDIDTGGVSDIGRCVFCNPGTPDDKSQQVEVHFDLFQTARLIDLIRKQHPVNSDDPISVLTAMGEQAAAFQGLVEELGKACGDRAVPRQTERRLFNFADAVQEAAVEAELKADKKKGRVMDALRELFMKNSPTGTPASADSTTATPPNGLGGARTSTGTSSPASSPST